MAKRRKKRRMRHYHGSAGMIYVKRRQTGKSNKSRDRRYSARKPGKRRSGSGKIYYEYRKNRTDIHKYL